MSDTTKQDTTKQRLIDTGLFVENARAATLSVDRIMSVECGRINVSIKITFDPFGDVIDVHAHGYGLVDEEGAE